MSKIASLAELNTAVAAVNRAHLALTSDLLELDAKIAVVSPAKPNGPPESELYAIWLAEYPLYKPELIAVASTMEKANKLLNTKMEEILGVKRNWRIWMERFEIDKIAESKPEKQLANSAAS